MISDDKRPSLTMGNIKALIRSLKDYANKVATNDGLSSKFKDIQHRGANTLAPENTLLAFETSKRLGFDYVECDVNFTKDNVPVILHDLTVDRTTGTELGDLHNLTYEQIKDLYANASGTGTSEYYNRIQDPTNEYVKIPTFEEFIRLCKTTGLHPYIELSWWASDKTDWVMSEAQVNMLYSIVKEYKMQAQVTWISFGINLLQYVKNIDKKARLGYLLHSDTALSVTDILNDVKDLRTGRNDVFLDVAYSLATADFCNSCEQENIPVEVWTVDSTTIAENLPFYVSGVTSNILFASRLRNNIHGVNGESLVSNRKFFVNPNNLPDYITLSGNRPFAMFTYLGNGLVRCELIFRIEQNDTTPKKGTVYVGDGTEIPNWAIPVTYQSAAVVWYNIDSNGQETTGVIRFGISMRYDTSAAVSHRFTLSELGKIPTGGANVRGSFIYSVNI